MQHVCGCVVFIVCVDPMRCRYDLESAAEAVKVALALGYTITRVEDVDSDESDAMDITPPNEYVSSCVAGVE